jgi:hypothetical protein
VPTAAGSTIATTSRWRQTISKVNIAAFPRQYGARCLKSGSSTRFPLSWIPFARRVSQPSCRRSSSMHRAPRPPCTSRRSKSLWQSWFWDLRRLPDIHPLDTPMGTSPLRYGLHQPRGRDLRRTNRFPSRPCQLNPFTRTSSTFLDVWVPAVPGDRTNGQGKTHSFLFPDSVFLQFWQFVPTLPVQSHRDGRPAE